MMMTTIDFCGAKAIYLPLTMVRAIIFRLRASFSFPVLNGYLGFCPTFSGKLGPGPDARCVGPLPGAKEKV